MAWHKHRKTGLSLVEVLLTAGLLALFFAGLLASFQGLFALVADSKARQTALTVALQTIESVRGLEYDLVGTLGGIPAGTLPQISTSTQNGIVFTTNILIEFVDDPADGLEALDSNGVITDYKRVVVTVEWLDRRNESRSINFTSNISPPGIETNIGGGTLRVNVVDASLQPVAGATVRLVNTGTDPAINTVRTTNANGVVLFSGAPTASGYEIEVTRSGYTTDQTHAITPSFPNPLTPPVTIVENNVTTATLFIDRVSQIAVKTLADQTVVEDVLSVTDMTDVASSSNSNATAGGMTLSQVAGLYADSGFVQFSPLSPSSFVGWQALSIQSDLPFGTNSIVQIYDGNNPTMLIPDAVLPGNSMGYTDQLISLHTIDASVYPSLSVRVSLETTDTTVAPLITGLSLTYIATETVLPNVSLSFVGNRSIGTDVGGESVLRNQLSTVTNSSGESTLANVEWDFYSIIPTGYVIQAACPAAPLTVRAGSEIALRLILGSPVATSLRVQVVDSFGLPISGASVTVSRPGYNTTLTTESCGQAFFAPLSANQYEVTAAATGFTTEIIPVLNVANNEVLSIQLLP
jgi:type II secretory pathway pseudopilin PulG